MRRSRSRIPRRERKSAGGQASDRTCLPPAGRFPRAIAMEAPQENRTLASRLGHNFLTGLFLLLPIGLTVALLGILLDLMGTYAQPLVEAGVELGHRALGREAPVLDSGLWRQGVILVSALLSAIILTVAGFLSKRIFGKVLQSWFSRLVERVPGLGGLYGSIRQMVDALTGRNKEMFRRVVLVEFPRPGCWSIGFVTHEQPAAFSEALGRQVVNVFVPNAPAPTAGFILQVEPSQIRETRLGVSQAIGLLVSFGAIMPRPEDKG